MHIAPSIAIRTVIDRSAHCYMRSYEIYDSSDSRVHGIGFRHTDYYNHCAIYAVPLT